MLDKIIYYSINNKVVIGLLTFFLVVGGIYSLYKLPIDALPDITNNQVQIITTSPSLAAQEVEQLITYPIEQTVKTVPNIVELRSISRFGLSVITVVFEEKTDLYWARAQIAERLKEAENNIPKELGTPELAPVSTGLGEIYQYVVFTKEGYETKYDATELRTIQDWIIKPQLLGLSGVAEVNTLGGYLKQFEIAIHPDKLKSLDISLVEIFNAIQLNNENTGGAYIDKKPYAYFIRGIGMLKGIEDIERTVVKVKNGIPILIKDIAKVQIGKGIRYGAVTKDGEGEKVSGMVMMLKGENSREVVNRVKTQMEKINETLPEGVVVEAFLDRSELVDNAIKTVRTNLIEGALIVIFILVLLLGNWRAGLVVASVIPLSMLFAVMLMNFFGVSGNLMSLGAIDFGLIVDGAVIIVEAIIHRLQKVNKNKLTSQEMNEEVYGAASKIRNSAAFGEIIILIVYLPILALVGIEGKMFGPMAQTVAFAILGAFLLSLTYVPMMSSLVLKNGISTKENLSDRIMRFLHSIYEPFLEKALKIKKEILVVSLFLFVSSLFVFNRLGGEFIPTLDEGNIATHLIIASGSSLSQEIESTTKAEKLLKENFPEIKQIVSKIGSAEIPTDPMPMEAADMMIILKDRSEWRTANSKEELTEKMEEVLNDIPGAFTEFSQPIQMRFNELMTGVRSDVAIKIFGEDLELLESKAEETVSLISSVKGVVDAKAERVAGLPQIVINYNKDKMAAYGLNVADVNRMIKMAFAGQVAGQVYEGQKKFDIVVRLDQEKRNDIEHLKRLYVSLPSGNQIPLMQVADISFEDGPMQISREEGKRRIVISFNVRGADVKTVVEEIQGKLSKTLQLPDGYYVTYGGQFENLIQANKRLAIAVPIALLMILLLLFFTFKSIKQTLLVFSAIPLSAIGGIIALWLRGMPFSISAGVGFIALFGVAVLNGIVLIGYLNQLKKEGFEDVNLRIKEGTKVRLRPVIMTAAVASLGFLPMALSNGAGAEVQKPLATVVIGGLISATLLTLIVLPILYYYSEKYNRWNKKSLIMKPLLFFLSLFSITASGQELSQKINLEKAISMGIDKNKDLESVTMDLKSKEELKGILFDLPMTEFNLSYGQINSITNDKNISISQQIKPFQLASQKRLRNENFRESQTKVALTQSMLIYSIRDSWNKLEYYAYKRGLLEKQINLLEKFERSASIRYETGETNKLEKEIAQAKYEEVKWMYDRNEIDFENELKQLLFLIGAKETFSLDLKVYHPLLIEIDSLKIEDNLEYKMSLIKEDVAKAKKKVSTSFLFPEFSVGYFMQSISGNHEVSGQSVAYGSELAFKGVNIGISVPIFMGSTLARNKAAQYEYESQQVKTAYVKESVETLFKQSLNQFKSNNSLIDFYSKKSLPNALLIEENATKGYQNGEISYVEYVNAVETALKISLKYGDVIKEHNETVNYLKYLLNR